jgi:3'-phosphoadenosine 5'-phosphosulfate sulfotransferase (PAPS reductase)/FAD synthetase
MIRWLVDTSATPPEPCAALVDLHDAEPVGPDLDSYDLIILAFSGGKDSLACLLRLLELGVPREKIELIHHDVDGREGSTLMDWRCTRDYCRKVAAAFSVPIYFSWKEGGFERELLRDNAPTARIWFETPTGLRSTGGEGKPNTRGLFPQVSPDLSVRWCSAYLKIDVCAAAIRNQERFLGKRTLVITGERAEESSARSKYKSFEPHRADLRNGRKPRHVDHWRPVHGWAERDVWAIIERWRVNVHVAYKLGWGRVSCAACIFGSANQWASLRAANPPQFNAVAAREARSGKSIQRKLTVVQLADRGTPYAMREADMRAATSETFDEPIFLTTWTQPAGAYGESCGPT